MCQTKLREIYDDVCRFTQMSNVAKTKPMQKVTEKTVLNLIFFLTTFCVLLNRKILKCRSTAEYDMHLKSANC